MKKLVLIRALCSFFAVSALSAPALTTAAHYLIVVPVKARPGVPQEPQIVVDLHAGPIPDAERGVRYEYDLSGYLSVKGDPSFDANQVTWGGSGDLPQGLVLTKAAVLTGVPTTAGRARTFMVHAQYKEQAVAQTYSITVNGKTLHATKVVAGGAFSCAITAAGGVMCWGLNGQGQLGDGTRVQSDHPVQVVGLESGVTDIALGTFHACAILQSGQVRCWGENDRGQLGAGMTSEAEALPQQVQGLSGVTSVALGSNFTCAASAGAAYCWGSNSEGVLGTGATGVGSSSVRVPVAGLELGVRSVTAAASHACAVQDSGSGSRAACWGGNSEGRLGDLSTTGSRSTTPVTPTGLASGVTAVESGHSSAHTCVVQNGSVKCWGQSGTGQVGTGGTIDVRTPSLVQLPGAVSQITVGGTHTCALAQGQGYCWGEGANGRLGIGFTDNMLTPVAVPALSSGVSQISAGGYHSCAVQDGDTKCWGVGSVGRLGTGSQEDALLPQEVIR